MPLFVTAALLRQQALSGLIAKKAVARLPPPENVFVEPLPCWAGKKET